MRREQQVNFSPTYIDIRVVIGFLGQIRDLPNELDPVEKRIEFKRPPNRTSLTTPIGNLGQVSQQLLVRDQFGHAPRLREFVRLSTSHPSLNCRVSN